MKTYAEINELAGKYIPIRNEIQSLDREYERLSRPTSQGIITCEEDYLAAMKELSDYEDKKQHIQSKLRELRKLASGFERDLHYGLLLFDTWIKVYSNNNPFALCVVCSDTDWGINVIPWADNLPDLKEGFPL